MQYAEMIDLIEEAKKAGKEVTGHVNQALNETFETWLDIKELGSLTDEEYEVLENAFKKSFLNSLL